MQKSSIKMVFFGSFEFAVPVLEALARPVRDREGSQRASVSNEVKAGYEIVAVITNPDKPAGRKQTLTPPPIKLKAESLKLKVLQPVKLRSNPEFVEGLKKLNPDIGIVAGYGKIIPPEIFNLPKHGTLVIHPSLLPKYRGPSPVQTVMLNGDLDTGVTIMKIDEELDHGPIVANYKLQITNYKTSQETHSALFKLGIDLLIKILPDYLDGKIKPIPQDHSKATFTKKFKTEDGEILPSDTLETAYNKIRALNPEPGTHTWLDRNNKKMRLKILRALPASSDKFIDISLYQYGQSGNLFYSKDSLALKLKNGYMILETVQLEGGKLMTIEEFLAGHPAELG